VDVVHVVRDVNEREKEKLNHTIRRVWGAGAYYRHLLSIINPPKCLQKKSEIYLGHYDTAYVTATVRAGS